MLSRQGYRILEADGGAQALEVAASSSATIHLLLTDVVMPGMTGPQLVERLRPLYPEMRVLYMSGYSEDVIAGRGLPVPAHCYIAKPFTPDALALKIRDVLAGGSQAFEASSPERAQ